MADEAADGEAGGTAGETGGTADGAGGATGGAAAGPAPAAPQASGGTGGRSGRRYLPATLLVLLVVIAVGAATLGVVLSSSGSSSATSTTAAVRWTPSPNAPTSPPSSLTAKAQTTPILQPTPGVASGPQAPAANASAPFTAHGSIGQAYVIGAQPGQHLMVVNAKGQRVGQGVADRFGSLIVRNLIPGPGYQVRSVQGTKVEGTPSFSVLGVRSTPPNSFYSGQHLHAGLNYITMRDGIKLAATVRLPPGKTLADGPFPTVIEYSGYAIAGPGNLITSILDPSKAGTKTLLPSTATAVGSVVAPLLGFATVSLQMRGTGCSGGAFDLFGLPTTYDGYDAVQIVGSQPWVAHHKVGLVGISFSGISQMFVGGTQPPDLAAIAPMSPTNDLYATGFPGGIFNVGFAGGWIAQRISDAQPAPTGGQTYAKALIRDGTQQCAANQKLRLQMQNIATLLQRGAHRTPLLYDQRSPEMWAAHVKVPVFLSGALQDEQTGPQWPAMIQAFSHNPKVFVTMVNGDHIDSLGPGALTRWVEFLNLYVADRLPTVPPGIATASGLLYKAIATAPSEPLPPLQYTNAPSVTAARADFASQNPRVTVLFTNGGGSLGPGAFQPVWQAGFSAWPPPKAVATTLDLAPGGKLSSTAPSATSTVSYRPTPTARPATNLQKGGNVWAALPPWNWTPVTGSEGLGFISQPLAHNVVAVGPASLNLMMKSSAANTDLQATVTEVMPNGQEMYVTSGFLRASDRALNQAASTPTNPVPTFLAQTTRPMPKNTFTMVRVPIDPLGFAFRAGSRIRVTITAPGGTRPAWAFTTFKTGGQVVNTVRMGGVQPSALVLSVVPGVQPPNPQPGCPSLRGEPCRTYVPAGNGG